jgi:hypothetical protein
MQIAECANTILDAGRYDGLLVEERLLHHESGIVLIVDFAENEATTVYVNESRELEGKGCGLEMCERYVELQDQAFEFVGWWREGLAGQVAATNSIVAEDLGAGVAVSCQKAKFVV